jgi:hypothetical protein
MRLSYPDMQDEIAEHLAARDALDPSDVLAEVQRLMLQIQEDTRHPLWRTIYHCTRVGTPRETGRSPYSVEQCGEAFMPLIEQAIVRLVRQALDGRATSDRVATGGRVGSQCR